jgi:hypothetical protein
VIVTMATQTTTSNRASATLKEMFMWCDYV